MLCLRFFFLLGVRDLRTDRHLDIVAPLGCTCMCNLILLSAVWLASLLLSNQHCVHSGPLVATDEGLVAVSA